PPFHVIPHGRDFDRFEALAESGPIREDEPLRVLVPGNIGRHKGGDLVAEVAAMAPPDTIEFHLLGTAPASLKAHVVDHGPYRRGEFATRVAGIRPHLAAVLSLMPETWCHTLTECWAAGIPVLALDRGATGERLREHGGGWLLEGDPTAAEVCRRLLELRGRTDERSNALQAVISWQQAPPGAGGIQEMGERYAGIYRGVLHTCGPVVREIRR